MVFFGSVLIRTLRSFLLTLFSKHIRFGLVLSDNQQRICELQDVEGRDSQGAEACFLASA